MSLLERRALLRSSLALPLAGLLPGLAFARGSANPLATPQQDELERLSLRLFDDPAVVAIRQSLRDLLLGDPAFGKAAHHELIRHNIDSNCFAAVQGVANSDPARPRLFWTWNPGHRWFGRTMPSSRFAFENPDNIFRVAPIAPGLSYIVRGRFHRPLPATQVFELVDSPPGAPGSRGRSIAVLSRREMAIADDGSFTVTIDSNAASGRSNHMQSAPGTTLLIVRDMLNDWANERACALAIELVGKPHSQEKTERELAERCADIIPGFLHYWLKQKPIFTNQPANSLPAPFVREGGWGFVILAHYDLRDDEAFVFTLDRAGAANLGVMQSSPWLGGSRYTDRSGSLNTDQAVPNRDGTYSYVVSNLDPGVRNWIDTGGVAQGYILIRWHELSRKISAAPSAVRSAEVLPLAHLHMYLPEAEAIAGGQRRRMWAERASAYSARYLAEV